MARKSIRRGFRNNLGRRKPCWQIARSVAKAQVGFNLHSSREATKRKMATNSENPTAGPLVRKLKRAAKCLPGYAWQRLTRSVPRGPVHLIITLADHFEPSSVPGFMAGHAPRDVQEQRLNRWCREYPRNFSEFRDAEGLPFNHTYFYP